MEIVFIRHAEKESDYHDSDLTDLGMKQAEHLARRLTEYKFDEFYCSSMARAIQTSEIVSKRIGIKPEIAPCLDEFKSESILKNNNSLTLEEKNRRADFKKFLIKIASDPNKEKSILIISHGLTNRLILSHFSKIAPKKLISFRQEEGAINSIYWADKFENWRLTVWNDNNHIPKELRSN